MSDETSVTTFLAAFGCGVSAHDGRERDGDEAGYDNGDGERERELFEQNACEAG
jgi:hypothetical protein